MKPFTASRRCVKHRSLQLAQAEEHLAVCLPNAKTFFSKWLYIVKPDICPRIQPWLERVVGSHYSQFSPSGGGVVCRPCLVGPITRSLSWLLLRSISLPSLVGAGRGGGRSTVHHGLCVANSFLHFHLEERLDFFLCAAKVRCGADHFELPGYESLGVESAGCLVFPFRFAPAQRPNRCCQIVFCSLPNEVQDNTETGPRTDTQFMLRCMLSQLNAIRKPPKSSTCYRGKWWWSNRQRKLVYLLELHCYPSVMDRPGSDCIVQEAANRFESR